MLGQQALVAGGTGADGVAPGCVSPERMRLVRGVVSRFAGDRDEADDLLQDTWLRVLQRWDQYAGRGDVNRWLVAIALNVCRSHVRATGRRRRLLESNGGAALVSDGFPPPDARLGRGHARVMAAFRSLPVRYQAALWCRVVEGNTNGETARRMNCPTGTVKTLVSRGLVRLRQEFIAAGSLRSNDGSPRPRARPD